MGNPDAAQKLEIFDGHSRHVRIFQNRVRRTPQRVRDQATWPLTFITRSPIVLPLTKGTHDRGPLPS